MKKKNCFYIVSVIACLIIVPFINSCDESFSPFEPVKEQYILFSALSVTPGAGLNVYQVTAEIDSVYQTSEYKSSGNNTSAYISGAKVYYTANGANYELKQQTRIDKTDPLNWVTKYVYSANEVIIKGGNKISISAKLPDGKVLSGQTQVPVELELKMSYPFQEGFSSDINRFLWGNALTVSWKTLTLGHLFFPKMELYYFNASKDKNEILEIPSKYISYDGKTEAFYPSCQFQNSISFEYNSVDSVISAIASADPQRQNKIYYLRVTMMEFDTPLSNYYSGIHGKIDRFSVRLDEDLFTNIKGGIGILGVGCISKTDKIKFREDYLKKFGYKYYEE